VVLLVTPVVGLACAVSVFAPVVWLACPVAAGVVSVTALAGPVVVSAWAPGRCPATRSSDVRQVILVLPGVGRFITTRSVAGRTAVRRAAVRGFGPGRGVVGRVGVAWGAGGGWDVGEGTEQQP